LNKKLIVIGIGMLLSANGAFAQTANSSVEIYGVIDLAVGTVSSQLNADGAFPATVNPISATKSATVTNSVSGRFNGGISDSRWGLRGTEDLGGGMKAIFDLESGFNANDGAINNAGQGLVNGANTTVTNAANSSLNGQLFNRQAWAGLSDETLGQITFGRNYAPIYDISVEYDPVQNAQLFSPLGFSGAYGGGGGVSEDTRVDNSLKYSNKIGDVNFGALYKFGGQAGSTSAQSGYTFNIGYNANGFGIQAAYQQFTDALKGGGSKIAGDVKVTAYDTTAYFLAAKYKFGETTLKAGWERYTLKAASDSYTAANIGSYYGLPVDPSSASYAGADQPVDIYFVGGDYNFTPALNLAAGYYDIDLKSYAAMGAVAGAPEGSIKAFSLLLDYHFSKRTDVYAGYMTLNYGDALYATGYNSNNDIAAVGIRHKF
jgi:predicted porin